MTATTLASLGATTIVVLVLAAFAAGWIDAVVGGGGLIQLPVLLLVPGMETVQALATNKLSSAMGTSTSAVTYYRRVRPGLATALPMAAVAAVGSAVGALSAAAVPDGVLEPVVLVALVIVAVYTLLRPTLGGVTDLRFSGHRHTVVAAMVGAVIGFYDGIAGPGTGAFLVFSLVGLLGYAFLEASATAKIVNLATNVGALVVFAAHGSVLWGLFLAVVGVLIVRLGWQVLQG